MLNALVSTIDKTLRARQGIFEYSDRPSCIFRVQLAANTGDVALLDGTCLAAGSHLINLHLWNEHVPPFPARGPTLGWARQMCARVELSLQELAAFVASHSALDDIAAITAKMMSGSTEKAQLAHIAARYGFIRSVDPELRHSFAQKLHLVGENILISMIMISHNPSAFRTDCFRRDRVSMFLRRTELMRRFGPRQASELRIQLSGKRPMPNLGSADDRK